MNTVRGEGCPQCKLRRSPHLRVAPWGLSSNPVQSQKTPHVWRSPTCLGGSNGGSGPGVHEGRFGDTAGAGLGGTLKRPSSPALPPAIGTGGRGGHSAGGFLGDGGYRDHGQGHPGWRGVRSSGGEVARGHCLERQHQEVQRGSGGGLRLEGRGAKVSGSWSRA